MCLKSQIFILYCIASEVWMAKQLESRRNFSQGLYPGEDDGSAKWNRLKRSLYQGRSCRVRGCCTGRDDGCSFNIVSRAAVCYCDQFCASGSPGPVDCCADYWDVCDHRVEPTRPDEPGPPLTSGCYRGGRYYGEGAIIKDNCNSCKCLQNLWKCSKEICLVRQDLIQHINSGDYGWKAANYTQFWGMTVEEGFKKRLGTFPPSHSLLNMKEPPIGSLSHTVSFMHQHGEALVVAHTGCLAQNYTMKGYQGKKLTDIELWSFAFYDLLDYSSQPQKDPLQFKMMGNSLPEEKFPAFFAATYAWPEWIHDPLDQRNCGASWAFSTIRQARKEMSVRQFKLHVLQPLVLGEMDTDVCVTFSNEGVAADRIAIHSGGQITDNLSAQNLISCDTRNQHGCNGGSIDGAWRYLKTHGVVSYACYPSFWKSNLEPSGENHCYVSSEYGKNHTNGPCPNAFVESNRLYRCAAHYRVSSKETDIMKEIMDKGPVQAIMKVYEDFFLYKRGIYRYSHKAGSRWKTHSVKLLGWGALTDKNGQKQKFWIAANSWGKTWGENGYFRILRGRNECDIEKLILATLG